MSIVAANLYPALTPAPPADAVARPVGHGVSAVLVEEVKAPTGLVERAVTAADLAAAGLTPDDAHRVALDNLVRFADDSPELSIQVLGQPGDEVHFLLFSDHPRAAACLLLPDLHEQAAEHLGATDLYAFAPHREALVVFPDRGRAHRDALVAKLREADAGAPNPVCDQLFRVAAAGVSPLPAGE